MGEVKKYYDPNSDYIQKKAEAARQVINDNAEACAKYGITVDSVKPFPEGIETPEDGRFPICAVYFGVIDTLVGWSKAAGLCEAMNDLDGVTKEEEIIYDDDNLGLHPAIAEKIGVFWEWYNPTANEGLSFLDCWADTETAPFLAAAEVLMAIAQEEGYFKDVLDEKLLIPNLTGYIIKDMQYEPEEDADKPAESEDGGEVPAETGEETAKYGPEWFSKAIYPWICRRTLELSVTESDDSDSIFANPVVAVIQ